MSATCPAGQDADGARTPFGSCLDAVRTLDPTRPDPTRPEEGLGLSKTEIDSENSPSPSPLQHEVWQILVSGLHSLMPNDHGRPWPYPSRATIARLVGEYDADLCAKAAREAKEIVQAQDRAPNISALFEKKLRDLAEVRNSVRESLEDEPCQ